MMNYEDRERQEGILIINRIQEFNILIHINSLYIPRIGTI